MTSCFRSLVWAASRLFTALKQALLTCAAFTVLSAGNQSGNHQRAFNVAGPDLELNTTRFDLRRIGRSPDHANIGEPCQIALEQFFDEGGIDGGRSCVGYVTGDFGQG